MKSSRAALTPSQEKAHHLAPVAHVVIFWAERAEHELEAIQDFESFMVSTI
jgi:hypothetical protein